MATKLFQDTSVRYGGGIKIGQGFILVISGTNAGNAIEGLIVQNLNIAVSRPVTPVYDLTSDFVYYVSARCSVQADLQRVCGPKGIVGAFYERLGDVCNAGENNMTFKLPTGCDPATVVAPTTGSTFNEIIAKFCILTDVQFACNVQNYIVSENCRITAAEINVDDTTSGSGSGIPVPNPWA